MIVDAGCFAKNSSLLRIKFLESHGALAIPKRNAPLKDPAGACFSKCRRFITAFKLPERFICLILEALAFRRVPECYNSSGVPGG